MFWKKVRNCLLALVIVALAILPIVTVYQISQAEQAQYVPPTNSYDLKPMAYGAPIPVTRQDLSETITLSGTVVSTAVIYEELNLREPYDLRLLVSTGDPLAVGDLIGYYHGEEIRATKSGIIRSIGMGSDAYVELWSLEDLAIECYVEDAQLNILQRESLDLTDEDGRHYQVSRIDTIRTGDDQTRVLLTTEEQSLTYGKQYGALRLKTGRIYRDCLVVDKSCVYTLDGENYLVRLVDTDGSVLDKVDVKVSFSMEDMVSVVGLQEGQLCDSGYKAIVER